MFSSNASKYLSSILGFSIDSSDDYTANKNTAFIPGIPPLLIYALILWATSAATYTFCEIVNINIVRLILVFGLVFASIFCIVFLSLRKKFVGIFLFAAVGVALGANSTFAFDVASENLPSSGTYDLIIQDDAKASTRGSYASATCILLNGKEVKVKAFFNEETSLLAQARIRAVCTFSYPSEEYLHSNYMSSINLQANVSSYEMGEVPFPINLIYDLREKSIRLLNQYGGSQAGIMQALLCGYRSSIQADSTYDAFKQSGIAHLVAVSGAHLAITTMALSLVLKFLRVPKRVNVVITILFLLAYLVFSGIPISALRAAIMCVLALVADISKRRNATLNSLAICIIAFIFTDASISVSISLFLSAASTLGIVLFSNLFCAWAKKSSAVVQNLFAGPMSMTISANLMTMPFSAAIFKILPIVAPISNLLVTPFFTIACVSGLIALIVSMIFQGIAPFAIGCAGLCASPIGIIASKLSALPYSCIDVELNGVFAILLSALIALLLVMFKPIFRGRHIAIFSCALALFLLVTSIRLPNSSTERIIMLDVGQGDAFIVQSAGKTLLIDTGNERLELASSLSYAGINKIDAVSISHSDSDHCDSLESITCLSSNAKFICAKSLIDCTCLKCSEVESQAIEIFGIEDLLSVSPGDHFKIGNFDFEVLWPKRYTDDGGNADSLCLSASLDINEDGSSDWKAVFTGDAESDELEEILNNEDIGDIDVLKVGHHGSNDSVSESVLERLKPEYALISVGEGNSYGHPTSQTLKLLEDSDIQVLRSDLQGVVELSFSQNGVSVQTQR